MKKYLLIGVSVLLIALIVVSCYFGYLSSFPIEKDCSNLEEHIDLIANLGYDTKHPNDIKLYKSIVVGKKQYVQLEVNGEEFGRVILTRGFTGRYSVDSLSYGSGDLEREFIESCGKKYLVFSGKNSDLEISTIKFTMDNKDYSIDIPSEELFLAYIEVDKNNMSKAKANNARGEVVQKQVYWSDTSYQKTLQA